MGARGGASFSPEREVRRLLLGLRNRHALASQPVARLLMQCYRCANEREAILALIRDTFAAGGRSSVLLSLVWKCDVEDCSQSSVAADLGMSPRQFFRYRKEAVAQLAARIAEVVPHARTRSAAVEHFAELLAQTDPDAAGAIIAQMRQYRDRGALHALIEARLGASQGRTIERIGLTAVPPAERTRILLRLSRELYCFGQRERGDELAALAVKEAAQHRAFSEAALFDQELTAVYRARYFESGERFASAVERAAHVRKSFDAQSLQLLFLQSEAALRCGDVDEAGRALDLAEPLALRRGEILPMALLLVGRAEELLARGNFEEALECFSSAEYAFVKRPLERPIVVAGRLRASLALGRACDAQVAPVDDLAIGELVVDENTTLSIAATWNRAYPKCYYDLYRLRTLAGLERHAAARDLRERCLASGFVTLRAALDTLAPQRQQNGIIRAGRACAPPKGTSRAIAPSL